MSAYIDNIENVQKIASAAAIAKQWPGPLNLEKATEEAQAIAVTLHAENVASVNHLYKADNEPEQIPPFELVQDQNPADVHSLARCLIYQSCEHKEWDASEARQILDKVQLSSVAPEYWDELATHNTPAAVLDHLAKQTDEQNPSALAVPLDLTGLAVFDNRFHRFGFIVGRAEDRPGIKTLGKYGAVDLSPAVFNIVWSHGGTDSSTGNLSSSAAHGEDVARFLLWANKYNLKNLTPAQAKRLESAQEEQHAAYLRQWNKDRTAKEAERAEFLEQARQRLPSWAKGVIIAEHHISETDIQSDYHGHRTDKVLILGWSKHTRDLFPELRKAAGNAEETAHLSADRFNLYPVLGKNFCSNGAHYYRGQVSPWHSEEAPAESFNSEEAAQAYAEANPLNSVSFEGDSVPFEWKISKIETEHREKYAGGGGFYLADQYRHNSGWNVQKIRLGYGKEFTPNPESIPTGEWRIPEGKPTPPKGGKPKDAGAATPGAVSVEKHTHTKRGFDFYICTLAERVDREQFADLLSQCKAAGGWYSRKWGTTPGGFAFKEKAAAEQFAASLAPSDGALDLAPSDSALDLAPSAPSLDLKKAEKLRGLAEGLQQKIESAFADRLTNTPKRLGQAERARQEGYRLERTQKALQALADHAEAGTTPEALSGINSKKAVYDLLASKQEAVANGFHTYYRETGEPASDSEEARLLWDLLIDDPERAKAEALRQKLNALQFSSIPGYFATPKAVADELLQHLDLFPGCFVFEPSAGSGSLCDAVKEKEPGALIGAIEINPTLCEILEAKGHNASQYDLLEFRQKLDADFVVMNPPFERLQDAEHVRRAFEFLKPGGRLVSVMSPSAFFNSAKKAHDFRDWFERVGGQRFNLPEGSFKESGTGVNAVYVVIDKPAETVRQHRDGADVLEYWDNLKATPEGFILH